MTNTEMEELMVDAHRMYIAGESAYFPAYGSRAYYEMEYALAQDLALERGQEDFPKMPADAYQRGIRYYQEAYIDGPGDVCWDEVFKESLNQR